MRGLRIGMAVFAAALALVGLSSTAYAFHAGGVAECAGCHNMHEASGDNLLDGSTASATCLACHQGTGSYHVATPSPETPGLPMANLTPGGDFGWLKKDYTWSPGWGSITEDGERHGHNIVANGLDGDGVAFDYVADSTNTAAPGGTYLNTDMSCASCHDPHGQNRRLPDGTIDTTGAPIAASGSYPDPVENEPTATTAVGVYRLLAGDGYSTNGVTYEGVPVAKVPSSYNRSEFANQTRTVYGYANPANVATTKQTSWSKWCGTCHANFHQDGYTVGSTFKHPTDSGLGTTVQTNYGQYIGSGDLTGSLGTSFLSLVPYVENSDAYATLATKALTDDTNLSGPSDTDRIGCLTCHRAHASGWEYALRWDYEIELIVLDGVWPGTDSTSPVASEAKWAKGRTVAERESAYNDYDAAKFATYQRSLCNKCHAKD